MRGELRDELAELALVSIGVRVRDRVGVRARIGVRVRVRVGVRVRVRVGVRIRVRVGVRVRVRVSRARVGAGPNSPSSSRPSPSASYLGKA